MPQREVTPGDVVRSFAKVAKGRGKAEKLQVTGSSTGGAGTGTPAATQPFRSPMTAPGSLITSGVGGAPLEILAGPEGYILKMVSGKPVWVVDAGAGLGGYYRQYVYELDGSGGWAFASEESGGQEYPVMELLPTEDA